MFPCIDCFPGESPPNGKKDNYNGKNGSGDFQSLREEEELIQKLKQHPGDLSPVSRYVQRNMEKKLPLPNRPGLCLRVCDLNGTIYMGQKYMLEGWEKLYLPQKTRMAVLGAVDSFPSMAPNLQLVILVAEDGRVFAYEDEALHLIADSLEKFQQNGIQNTGTVYWYCPEAESEEDEEILRNDPEIKEIRQRTRDFVDSNAEEFGKLLGLI